MKAAERALDYLQETDMLSSIVALPLLSKLMGNKQISQLILLDNGKLSIVVFHDSAIFAKYNREQPQYLKIQKMFTFAGAK